jgi:hypothetical protein
VISWFKNLVSNSTRNLCRYVEVKYIFSVKSLEAFLYADALFEYHAREKDRASDKLKVNDTDSSLSMSQADVRKRMIQQQFDKEAERFGDFTKKAVSGEVDLDVLLPKFNEVGMYKLNSVETHSA